MTSALIALVFLVVWYGGMLLAFWLIDRQIDDPASPEGRREKTFAMNPSALAQAWCCGAASAR